MNVNWNLLTPTEASEVLFQRCVEFLLINQGHNVTTDTTVRLLTQRLYGDYRQIHNTAEFKRADKHVKYFKNSGLGYELF